MCEETKVNINHKKTKIISFSEHENEKNPIQTKFVEIKYSEEMGKGLFALNDIKPGK